LKFGTYMARKTLSIPPLLGDGGYDDEVITSG
jgi:hypothetical protein